MRRLKTVLLLVLTIFTSVVYGQLKRTTHFSRSIVTRLCSQSIVLDSLGFFFKEHGCEGDSYVSFGRYRISKKNVITFFFLPIDSLQPFNEIKRSRDVNDSLLTFSFYDRMGQPINQSSNFEAVRKDSRTENVRSDTNGKIRLNRMLYRDVLISPILSLYNEQIPLVKGDENNIEVHLALPAIALEFYRINFERPVQEQFIIKTDGLYALDKKTKVFSIEK